MKYILLSVMLLSASMKAQTSDPLTRYPSISSSVYSNLIYWESVAEAHTYPKSLLLQEGQKSDAYSSAQGIQDYFVVYAPNLPGHATVLVMDPIPTSYYGVQSYPVHFHDALNNADYYIPHASDLQGTFVIAGQTVYVNITFDPTLTSRYPMVQLTWGEGAGYGDVGAVFDDLENVVLDIDAPTDMTLHIQNAVGVQDVPDGVYIGNESAYGESYVIQSSTDMVTWTTEANQPFLIVGYTYVHQFPPTDGNKFFRAMKKP